MQPLLLPQLWQLVRRQTAACAGSACVQHAACLHTSPEALDIAQPSSSAQQQPQQQRQGWAPRSGVQRNRFTTPPTFKPGSLGSRLMGKHMLLIRPESYGVLDHITKGDLLNFFEDGHLRKSDIIPAYEPLSFTTAAYHVFYDSEDRCRAAASLGQEGRIFIGAIPVFLGMPGPTRKSVAVRNLVQSRMPLLWGTTSLPSPRRGPAGTAPADSSPVNLGEAALMPSAEDSMIMARSARQQGHARAVVLLTVDAPLSSADKDPLAATFFDGYDLLAPRVFTMDWANQRRQERGDQRSQCLVHFANSDEAFRALRTKQNALFKGKPVRLKLLE